MDLPFDTFGIFRIIIPMKVVADNRNFSKICWQENFWSYKMFVAWYALSIVTNVHLVKIQYIHWTFASANFFLKMRDNWEKTWKKSFNMIQLTTINDMNIGKKCFYYAKTYYSLCGLDRG